MRAAVGSQQAKPTEIAAFFSSCAKKGDRKRYLIIKFIREWQITQREKKSGRENARGESACLRKVDNKGLTEETTFEQRLDAESNQSKAMRSSHVTSWGRASQTQCRRAQRSRGRQNSEDPEWLEWKRMGEEKGHDAREATAVDSAWCREVREDLESRNNIMSTHYCKEAAVTWVGASKLISVNNYVSVYLEQIRYRNYQKIRLCN